MRPSDINVSNCRQLQVKALNCCDLLSRIRNLVERQQRVGKSTLINQLIPDAEQRTAEISEAHNSGMHTTTFSEMLELPEGGYLIDTRASRALVPLISKRKS